MGEQIINRDPDTPALLVRQAAQPSRTAAITVQQTGTSGTGPALNVVSDNAAAPAITVRGAGDLLRLRDANGVEVFKVGQGGASIGPPMPAAGHYLFTAAASSTTTSNALGVGTLRLAPWLVTRAVRLDRIGGDISSAGEAGSKLRLGIYADNGNAYPGALVVDAGQIAGDSATVQELTIDAVLAAGLYWVGGAVQTVTTTQPTVRILNAHTVPISLSTGTSAPTAGQVGYGYAQAGVTGALPSTFSATVSVSGSAARVHVRAA